MFHHECSSSHCKNPGKKIHYWNIGIIQLGNITWKHYLETLPRTITWKQNLETQFGNIWNFRNFATMNFKKVMMYRGESESLTLIILDQPTNHLPRSNKTDIERTYHFCVKSSWCQFQAGLGGHRPDKDSTDAYTQYSWANMKMHVHCILIGWLTNKNQSILLNQNRHLSCFQTT